MIQILLATWNSERYLAEQLDSLFAQTYQNFEILIHDGGSSDNTVSIIHRYMKQYPEKIRFLGSEQMDACANFAKLLECADGELFMFCDHDDVWKKEKIDCTLKAYKKAEQQYGNYTPLLVFTDLEIVDSDLNKLHSSMMNAQHLNKSSFTIQKLAVQNAATGNTMLFNKALRDLVLPIPQQTIMHDYWVVLTAALLGKIIYLDSPLILYRQHNNNVIGSFRYDFVNICKKVYRSRQELRNTFYRKMDQLTILLTRQSDKLDAEKTELLASLQKLKNMNYLEKRIFLLKNKFKAEGFLRNLGMYLVI